MLDILGSLTTSPWIYIVIVASVLLDVFVPLLPSGVLVITGATAVAGTRAADAANRLPNTGATRHLTSMIPEMLLLVVCAAGASIIGDLVAYRLAWRGGDRFDRAIARSRRLTVAQERLGHALARGGGGLVVLARFAPAGRSVVSLAAGAVHREARKFVPWSVVAAFAWAAYSVGLGYLGAQWLGASWFGSVLSVAALFAAGALAAYVIKRRPEPVPATATAPLVPAQLPHGEPTTETAGRR